MATLTLSSHLLDILEAPKTPAARAAAKARAAMLGMRAPPSSSMTPKAPTFSLDSLFLDSPRRSPAVRPGASKLDRTARKCTTRQRRTNVNAWLKTRKRSGKPASAPAPVTTIAPPTPPVFQLDLDVGTLTTSIGKRLSLLDALLAETPAEMIKSAPVPSPVVPSTRSKLTSAPRPISISIAERRTRRRAAKRAREEIDRTLRRERRYTKLEGTEQAFKDKCNGLDISRRQERRISRKRSRLEAATCE